MKNTIKLLGIIALVAVIGFSMVGCSGLSGTYENENGSISIAFTSFGKCTWNERGSFFNGTYEKTSTGYQLKIMGGGMVPNQAFNATRVGNALTIPVYGREQRFTKK
jgi:hypothetical protein